MKLVYATDINAANIHNWSGLSWYYRKMLEDAGCEVTTIDKGDMPHPPLPQRIKKYLVHLTSDKHYSLRFSTAVSQYYAQRIQRRLAPGSVVLSPNTVILAYLKKNLKKVLYADATFDSLMHLYPKYKQLTTQCQRDGEAIDQQAVANADLLIYTSQWAADSAVNHYGADPAKIALVPFGANLDKLPPVEEVKQHIAARMRNRPINLLFLGIDWVRKGGDYAVQVASRLNELGFPTTLHIVGAVNLPTHINQPFVVNHGFISKATSEGQQQLGALLSTSHFLMLPTLADCTPVACSEANAFGVPCITSDVGGLTSIVKNEVNGHTFAHRNFADDAVRYIVSLMSTSHAYKELCCSSHDQYTTELNWNSVGRRIVQLINEI
jgi:glycosyltransferase involved in cell wall biosynthesis